MGREPLLFNSDETTVPCVHCALITLDAAAILLPNDLVVAPSRHPRRLCDRKCVIKQIFFSQAGRFFSTCILLWTIQSHASRRSLSPAVVQLVPGVKFCLSEPPPSRGLEPLKADWDLRKKQVGSV